jgi:hypothetical protein
LGVTAGSAAAAATGSSAHRWCWRRRHRRQRRLDVHRHGRRRRCAPRLRRQCGSALSRLVLCCCTERRRGGSGAVAPPALPPSTAPAKPRKPRAPAKPPAAMTSTKRVNALRKHVLTTSSRAPPPQSEPDLRQARRAVRTLLRIFSALNHCSGPRTPNCYGIIEEGFLRIGLIGCNMGAGCAARQAPAAGRRGGGACHPASREQGWPDSVAAWRG